MSLAGTLAIGEGTLLLSLILGTVVHEAGHAMAARAVGLDVRLFSIGQGAAYLHRRIGGVLFVLRAVPWSGFVAIAVQPGMSPRAYAAMVAAGPAANLLLLACAAGADHAWPRYDTVLEPFGIAQAMLFALTLLPYRSRARGAPRPSDGLQLWTQLVRKPPDMFTKQYAGMAALLLPKDALLPVPSVDAPDLVYQIVRSDRQIDLWAARDAAAAVQRLLRQGCLNTVERAVALNFLAGNETLFCGTGATPAELQGWASEARDLAPGPAASLTLGGVLATTGRGAEAEALLQPLVGTTNTVAETVLVHLHLAQAAADQGRFEDARARLSDARLASRAKGPMRRILTTLVTRAAQRPPLAAMDPAPHTAISAA